jgi:hypothetical protein
MGWICDYCGYKNIDRSKNCQGCFKLKKLRVDHKIIPIPRKTLVGVKKIGVIHYEGFLNGISILLPIVSEMHNESGTGKKG